MILKKTVLSSALLASSYFLYVDILAFLLHVTFLKVDLNGWGLRKSKKKKHKKGKRNPTTKQQQKKTHQQTGVKCD